MKNFYFRLCCKHKKKHLLLNFSPSWADTSAMNDKVNSLQLWNLELFIMYICLWLSFEIFFNQRILFLKSFFSQECFEILTRSTKVLREEYLDRHEKARREIERRCASLEAKKSQQHMTLVKLTQVCLLPIFSWN